MSVVLKLLYASLLLLSLFKLVLRVICIFYTLAGEIYFISTLVLHLTLNDFYTRLRQNVVKFRSVFD